MKNLTDTHKALDTLLGSELHTIYSSFPDSPETTAKRLEKNVELFGRKLEELGAYDTVNISYALQEKVVAIEAALAQLPVWGAPHIKNELKKTVRHIFSLCPEKQKRGFFLKENVARQLLRELPPIQLLTHVPHKEVSALSPLSILALTRFTETKDWQERYLARLATLSARHFMQRDIRCLVIDSDEFAGVIKLAGEKQKPWRLSHSKEIGIITCFTLEKERLLPAPLTQYIAVFMHYFFEIADVTASSQAVAKKKPNQVGTHLRDVILSHKKKFEFFHPNTYSEHQFWEKALTLFISSFPEIPELEFFKDTIDCGGYASNDIDIISLNLVDQIWDINLGGKAETVAYFGNKRTSFLYHFREALWYDLFRTYLGISKEEMRQSVIENLNLGDRPFTDMMVRIHT